MWEKIKNFGTNVLFAILIIVLLAGLAAMSAAEKNREYEKREAVYVQGQYDALYGNVSLLEIVTDGLYVESYAQGHDDAYDGKIIIKSITDSTFVFTKSPWKTRTTVPTDTIKVKQ